MKRKDDQCCIGRGGCYIRGVLNKSLLDIFRDEGKANREGLNF